MWSIRHFLYSFGAIRGAEKNTASAPLPPLQSALPTSVEETWYRKGVFELSESLVRFFGPLNEDAVSLGMYKEQVVNSYCDRNSEPCLLVHGDPYPPNLMLRRDTDNNKINGVAFVDLGTVRPGGPLADLYGFLTLTMDPTLFHDKWEKGADGKRSHVKGVKDQHGAHRRFLKVFADRLHELLPEESGVFQDDLYPDPVVSLTSQRTLANSLSVVLSYGLNKEWFFRDEKLKERYLKMIRFAGAVSFHAENRRKKAAIEAAALALKEKEKAETHESGTTSLRQRKSKQ